MYPEGAQRLVRRDWSAIGTDYLKGPPENWTPQMVGMAVNGMAVGLQQLMEEMSLLLGSKGIPVNHGYPVKFRDTLPAGATDAVLEVANYPIPPQTNDDALDDITNGFAFRVTHGKACFRGPVCFDGAVTGIAGNAGVVCWGKVKHNGVHADGTVGHTLGTVDTWDSTVTVTPVTDKGGATPTGEADRTVYAWRDQLTDPNFRLNDVIPFVKDENNIAITYAGRDKKIGKTDSGFEIADPTSPIDYTAANGHRGWRVADGTNSTEDLGGQVMYGWKAGGAFATVGANIAASVTGTVSAHAASGSDATVTVATTGGGPASVTVASNSTGVAAASTFVIDEETTAGTTATDPALIQSLSDPGHAHTATIAHSAITAAFTASVTDDAIAAALANHSFSSSTVLPAGQVAVVLQRVN